MGFISDRRAVSELLGSALIIGITIVLAVLVVGLAGSAIQAIGDESQDSLSNDAFHEMTDRVDGVAASQVGAATAFQFPAGAGTSVTPLPAEGTVRITASVADPDHADHVVADAARNATNFTLGTVVYEDRRGQRLVYQGGGLWSFPSAEYAEVRSNPPFDYDGRRVNFKFVDLSNLTSIGEGEAVTVAKRGRRSSDRSAAIRRNLSAQWTIDEASDFTVPVDLNVTVESRFAYGWKVYAEEGMTHPPDAVTYRPNDDNDHQPNVTLSFDHVGSSDLPEYPGPILYAGPAGRAAQFYDPFGNATINATGEASFRIEDNKANKRQQLALFNETSGEWLIHGDVNGVPPARDMWTNVSNWADPSASVHDSPTGQAAIADSEHAGANYDEYTFAEGAADTKLCVVAYDDEDIGGSVRGVIDHLETCSATLDVTNRTRYMPTDLSINITTNVTDAVMREPENVTLAVENVGEVVSTSQHDVGLYREAGGELRLVDYATSEAIGDIDPGENATLNMTWTPRNLATEALHAIVGVHDTDTENVSVEGRDVNLTVNVTEDTDATVPLGEQLTVNATVNNTGNAAVTDANVVLRESDGVPVDRTQITLEPGNATNATLSWSAPVEEFTEELEVQALNGNDTHTVTDAGTPSFAVTVESLDGPAESNEPLNLTATVENTGDATGTQELVMTADTERVEGLIADSATVSDLAPDESREVALSWDSPINPVRGNNSLIVRSRDDTAIANFDVAARYDVEIEAVTPSHVDRRGGSPGGGSPGGGSPGGGATNVAVDVTVTNRGDATGSEPVWLGIPDASDLDLAGRDNRTLTVDGGGTESITLSSKVLPHSPTGNLSVSSPGDTDRARVVVQRSGPDCGSVSYPGDGTGGNPYEISSVDQLQCLDRHVAEGIDDGANYILTEDIDAYGTAYWNESAGFEPIGVQDRHNDSGWFAGNLDGQGHTIEGLTIDRRDEGIVGMFATTASFDGDGVGKGVTIADLVLENVSVHGKSNVGGLVGGAGGTIQRVSVSGTVTAEYQEVGGIVGTAHDADLSNKLVSTATVRGGYPAGVDGEHPWGSNSVGIGGIVGATGFNTDVSTAYSRATVSGNSAVGGITGWTSDYASENEQMYWVDGLVELTGERRLDEIGRQDLEDDPTAGAIAGRMELNADTFRNSVYADENYPAIGEQKADADAVSLPPSEMTGPQVLPDSLADEYPGITAADTDGTMANLDWDIYEPVYDINESGAIVDEGYPVFEWQVQGQFVVESIDAPTAVTEGDTLTVNATVENTKTHADTQVVRLFNPDGNPVAANETTLPAGHEEEVTLTWNTRVGDNTSDTTDPTLAVRTADTGSAAPITVREQTPPQFEIDTVEDPENVTELDRVDVDVTLQNTGGAGAQSVFLKHNGTIVNGTTVSLEADAATTVTVSWYTEVGDAGHDQPLTVETPADSAETSVNVTTADLAEFTVGDVGFPGYEETPVLTAGESLNATVLVSNTGGHESTELVWLTPAGSEAIFDHNETTLAPGEDAEFNLTWVSARPEVEILQVHVGGGATVAKSIVVRESVTSVASEPISVDLSMITVAD